MPLLNFKPMFVDPIRQRRKRHTIRADRKIPIKVGDRLYLYCGLRHKGAYRILPEPVECTKALPISIVITTLGGCSSANVSIDGQRLSKDECERLAVADGFSDWAAMERFWIQEHGLTNRQVHFSGQIIHWR